MKKQELIEYAKSKKLPTKIFNDIIKRLDSIENDTIDEYEYFIMCAELDNMETRFQQIKHIIDRNRKEREERKQRQE